MKRFGLWGTVFVLLLACLWAGVGAEETSPVVTPAPTLTSEQWLQLWYQASSALRETGDYPYVVLRKGDLGYEVRNLQTRLAELGYYNKSIADNFGAGTYSALRLFEKANHLRVDGVASVSDQKMLFSKLAVPNANYVTAPSGNSTDDATPTATGSDGLIDNVDVLRTLKPDIFDNMFATATPTLILPRVTIPKYNYPFP